MSHKDHKYYFRKLDTIGASDAKGDELYLKNCFVDTGEIAVLEDFDDPRRLIVGRTGFGKTALLYHLTEKHKRCIVIRPDSLALAYISNSTILNFFMGLGVDMDTFFRLLWRHVFTVEIVQRHYKITNESENPSGYVQVLEEYQGSSLSNVYNYGMALISQRQPGVSTNYFIFDGHGSTRILADIGGNVVNAFAYDAYGTLIASNGVPQTAYLYCGQQFDSDLGLYLNRARYLNPNTGRFWTMDTCAGDNEDPLSLHKYLYCQADPISNTDPTGLFSQAFGEMAHDIIAGRYLAEHPGTIINPTTGILGALKPDIFNGPALRYAEIKPLSFKGIAEAWIQIEAYDKAYGKLGFSRETSWPPTFTGAFLAGNWIVYFNIDGIIFYSDAVDDIKDLKNIRNPSTAFQVLRNLVSKNINVVIDFGRQLAKGVSVADEVQTEDEVGIASENTAMGAP